MIHIILDDKERDMLVEALELHLARKQALSTREDLARTKELLSKVKSSRSSPPAERPLIHRRH